MPHTAVATVAAIELAGARPGAGGRRPGDHDTGPGRLEAHASRARTRAIMPVHLYGHPADLRAAPELATRARSAS